MTKRAHWGSQLGFIFAAAGSAIGLANIWRFPYMAGQYGGAGFIAVYLLCLLLIGFPVFIAEILIGRKTQTSPAGAFRSLGGKYLGWAGKLQILTGFIVSSFYSAVAGWMLGYLFESLTGAVSNFSSAEQAASHYNSLMEHPWWAVGFHGLFMLSCTGVLYLGVRAGIERSNKIFMPMLFGLLILIAIYGLTLNGAGKGLSFLLAPNWSALTPTAFLMALGHSFFTLSLGQGTMVTYGSYLKKDSNILRACFPIVIMDTMVSLLASVAIFTIVFSANLEPNSGPGLVFHTLPLVFSQVPLGYVFAIAFFLIVVLAALTSEISAMEPVIAYLMDEWKWNRHAAVLAVATGAFLVGVPCALSTSVLKEYPLFGGGTVLDWMDFIASGVMIPLGGLCAVLVVGRVWGVVNALRELKDGSDGLFERKRWLTNYFWLTFKYTAPVLVVLVFLSAMGLF